MNTKSYYFVHLILCISSSWLLAGCHGFVLHQLRNHERGFPVTTTRTASFVDVRIVGTVGFVGDSSSSSSSSSFRTAIRLGRGRTTPCYLWSRRYMDPRMEQFSTGNNKTCTTSTTAASISTRQTSVVTTPTRLFSLAQKANVMEFVSHPKDKNVLTKAYQRGRNLFAALGVLLWIIPDRTLTVYLATKLGGAAGFGVAAGLCHILAVANNKDRLSSDTYVRLNLGLLGFSALGVLCVPAEAGFLARWVPAALLSVLLTCAKVYGILLGFVGWKRGIDPADVMTSLEEMVKELKEGTIASVKGLRVDDAKKSLAYRNCLLLVCLSIFSNLMEASFNFRHRQALHRSLFEISLNGSAASRLFMMATIVYTLKDAAERDRLTGTTFIQLNFMVGAWAWAVALGQAIYPGGIAFYRGVEMFAFSIPFLTKAWKSLLQKEKEKRQELGNNNNDDDTS